MSVDLFSTQLEVQPGLWNCREAIRLRLKGRVWLLSLFNKDESKLNPDNRIHLSLCDPAAPFLCVCVSLNLASQQASLHAAPLGGISPRHVSASIPAASACLDPRVHSATRGFWADWIPIIAPPSFKMTGGLTPTKWHIHTLGAAAAKAGWDSHVAGCDSFFHCRTQPFADLWTLRWGLSTLRWWLAALYPLQLQRTGCFIYGRRASDP